MTREGPSQKGPLILMGVAALFCAGPVFGLVATVIGMVRTFSVMSTGSARPEDLAAGIDLALRATLLGMLLVPVGGIILLIAIYWLIRNDRKTPPTYPAPAA